MVAASFPGPAQLSVASILQATESWAGPGYEASVVVRYYIYINLGYDSTTLHGNPNKFHVLAANIDDESDIIQNF